MINVRCLLINFLILFVSFELSNAEEITTQTLPKNFPTKQESNTPSQTTSVEFEEAAKRTLAKSHPDWEEVVTSKEFKDWMNLLPKAEKERLNNSWDPYFIAEKITAFKLRKLTQSSTTIRKDNILYLVCNVENTSLTFEVNFDKNTVSGKPATISNTSINFTNGVDSTVIGRYSGDISIISKGKCIRGTDCIYYGSCKPQQFKQF